jgi:hypothetical protein
MTAHMRKEGNETLRVVVVDDDSFYREYVARLLEVAGDYLSKHDLTRDKLLRAIRDGVVLHLSKLLTREPVPAEPEIAVA